MMAVRKVTSGANLVLTTTLPALDLTEAAFSETMLVVVVQLVGVFVGRGKLVTGIKDIQIW